MIRRPSSRARTAPSRRRQFRPSLLGLEDRTLLLSFTTSPPSLRPRRDLPASATWCRSTTRGRSRSSATSPWQRALGECARDGTGQLQPVVERPRRAAIVSERRRTQQQWRVTATDRYFVGGDRLSYYTREWSPIPSPIRPPTSTRPGQLLHACRPLRPSMTKATSHMSGWTTTGACARSTKRPPMRRVPPKRWRPCRRLDVDANGDDTPVASPRPQLTANGDVVVYDPSLTTLSLFDPNEGSAQVIASPARASPGSGSRRASVPTAESWSSRAIAATGRGCSLPMRPAAAPARSSGWPARESTASPTSTRCRLCESTTPNRPSGVPPWSLRGHRTWGRASTRRESASSATPPTTSSPDAPYSVEVSGATPVAARRRRDASSFQLHSSDHDLERQPLEWDQR